MFYSGGLSFNGPFFGNYTTADVRVRVWKMCDFLPANFTSANAYNVSTSGKALVDMHQLFFKVSISRYIYCLLKVQS